MIQKNKENQYEKQLELQRNLEFAIYTTTFAGMSGVQVYKGIKKPSDLYKLPSDKRNYKPIKIDKENLIKSVDKVKQSNNFKTWQQKT